MSVLDAFIAANQVWLWALAAAILAGGAFLIVVYIGVLTRITTMHYMYILGSLFMPTTTSFVAHTLGFSFHMSIISIGLGLLHLWILNGLHLESVGSAMTWELLMGAVQGVVFVALIPLLLAWRRPPTRWAHINNPGLLLLGFGWLTPVVVLAESLAFGVVFGAVYSAALLHS